MKRTAKYDLVHVHTLHRVNGYWFVNSQDSTVTLHCYCTLLSCNKITIFNKKFNMIIVVCLQYATNILSRHRNQQQVGNTARVITITIDSHSYLIRNTQIRNTQTYICTSYGIQRVPLNLIAIKLIFRLF